MMFTANARLRLRKELAVFRLNFESMRDFFDHAADRAIIRLRDAGTDFIQAKRACRQPLAFFFADQAAYQGNFQGCCLRRPWVMLLPRSSAGLSRWISV